MFKVLIVVKGLPLGGISSVIFSYYNAIIQMKLENVHIDFATCSIIDEQYRKDIEAGNSKIYITNKDKNPLIFIRDIAQIVRNNKYDIVHVHGNSALIMPDLLGAKIGGAKIRIAHSHSTSCNNMMLNSLVKPIFLHLYTVALACSKKAGEWMFGNKPFIIMQNAIDIEKYKYDAHKRTIVRNELNISDCFVIGHVGQINENKNQMFLVKLFKEYKEINPNSKLLLVGDGPLENDIRGICYELGIEKDVILFGRSDNVKDLLMAMDCFVLPSHYEGMPCVLVEAQATGLPCIVSDNVSSDSKMSKTFLFKSIDKKQWIDAIRKFDCFINRDVNSEANIIILRNNGYDIRKAAERLVMIYKGAAG